MKRKIVMKPCTKVSKLGLGLDPFSRSTYPFASNFTYSARSSIPRRVKVNRKRKSRIEKLMISLRLPAILSIII